MKTKFIRAFAVAAVAASATLQARAVYYDWKGISGATSYFDDLSCWGGNPGTDISKDNHYFGYGAVTVLNTTVTSRKSQSLSGVMNVKKGTYSFVAEADSHGINSTANIEIGSATATAEFKSGTYKFNQTQIGKASGQTGTLKVSGGTFTSSAELIVGNAGTGYLEIDGGTVKTTGTYSQIGAGGNGVVTIKSGSFDNLSASNQNLTFGQNAGCSGTLNVEGGTFTVGGQIFLNYDASSVKSTINITGGTLTAQKIYLNQAGTNGGTITIDGGTLKAYANRTDFLPAHDNLHVYVGDAGATFDTGGCNITIAEDIEDKSGEAGVVAFTGGGLVTLSGTPSYTGGTTVEAGTALSLTTAAKDAVFAHDVAVEIPSTGAADGATVFQITDGGTFTEAEVEAITVTATDEGRYLLALAAGDAKVVIVDTQAAEYVWNGGSSGANWSDEDTWLRDGAAATWADSNIAVFANDGDESTLDSDVTAASVTFREDATVSAGGGTITVPSVSVVSDVSATIDAPTAGTLEKTGSGTLTLGASRTEQTLLTEGTLVMSGSGTTLDWSKLTLGTDAAKPVTLVFTNGATLANQPLDVNFPTTANMTATIVKDSGDWNLTGKNFLLCGAAGTTAELIQNGGTLTCGWYFVIGNNSSATSASMTINGGTVNCTRNADDYIAIGSHCPGSLTVKGANSAFNATANSLSVGRNKTGTLTVEDGGTVSVATDICLSRNSGGAGSSVTLKSGGTMVAERVFGNYAGTFVFDGGILKARTTGKTLIDGSNNIAASVTSNGGTVDADGKTVTINAAISGEGAMTFTGGGKVTLSGTPSYTGGTTVEAGTTLSLTAAAKDAIFAHDVAVEIPSTGVAHGATVFQITDGGTFTQAEIEAITVTGTDADRYSLGLAFNDTDVIVIDTQAAEYVWNGGSSGANWTDEGKWLCDGEAATWEDSNIAVFENEGDCVTVDSDVTAASVTFREDATVSAGGGTLTVPSVSVVSDVSATILAPTAGALEKTGTGTLTLGASRGDTTTLTEGTLVMTGDGTTLDWSKLALGTDARKPVTLVFTNGATLANQPLAVNFPTTVNTRATIVKDSGDWNLTGKNFLLCGAAGTTAEFIHNGGTLTCGNYFVIGNNSSATSASMTINGGTVNCTRNADDYIAIGSHCLGSLTVKGANSAFNATANSLSVGRNKAGTLTVEDGGTVSVATDICLSRNSGGAGSSVTLKSGGTMVVERVFGNYAGSFVFDGGILKARTTGKTLIDGSNNLNVSVTSNGGTVDSDGKTVTINAAISGEGGMTFKGGGTVTLASGNTYTGTTTVEVGTTVKIPSADALVGGLTFILPATTPAVKAYSPIVIDGEGTFDASILYGVVRPEGVTALRLSGDGKSVICVYGDPENTWIGGTSGSLDDWANWSLGYVPYDSCVIGVATAATLTNPAGSLFAPSSITFPADSAAVTIDGESAISNIDAIINLSSTAHHVFNVPVSGRASAAIVMNTQTYCVFNGGMTAYDVDFSQSPASDNARTFAGQWTLTKTSDWTPAKNATVASGASLTVKNYSNSAGDTLLINAGGVVTAEVAKTTGSTDGWLTRGIYGTMVVTDECKMDGTALNRIVADEASTGTIMARKFSSTSTSIKYFLKDSNGFRQVVGAGGISGTGWQAYADWNSVIGCAADFDITGEIKGYTSGTKNTFTFDTTGRYRIALVSGGKLTGERMAINVTGNGTFAFAGGTADFQQGLTVNSGATVAVNAGCTPGNGEVKVKDGAAFEVTGGGAAPLGGNLKLMDGATLRFNFTSRRNPPVLKMNGNPVWFGSQE